MKKRRKKYNPNKHLTRDEIEALKNVGGLKGRIASNIIKSAASSKIRFVLTANEPFSADEQDELIGIGEEAFRRICEDESPTDNSLECLITSAEMVYKYAEQSQSGNAAMELAYSALQCLHGVRARKVLKGCALRFTGDERNIVRALLDLNNEVCRVAHKSELNRISHWLSNNSVQVNIF